MRDAGEAVAFVNARPKPLALYVFSGDSDVPQRFVDETSSGGVCVNDCLWVRADERICVCDNILPLLFRPRPILIAYLAGSVSSALAHST